MIDPASSGLATVPAPALISMDDQFLEVQGRLLAMLRCRIDSALVPRLDAEDLLMDVYIRAKGRWPQFARSGMPPFLWFRRQALDVLSAAWKRENRLRREIPWPEHSSIQLGLGLLGSTTNPSVRVDRAEVRARVQLAFDRLDDATRKILAMRHIDGLTFPEIGEELGIRDVAAAKRYSRAARRFKRAWEDVQTSGAS